jgi:hypothetical protein
MKQAMRISRSRWAAFRPVLDLLRPGSTSLGIIVPIVLALTVVAVVVAIVGQAVVPWAIYPAL